MSRRRYPARSIGRRPSLDGMTQEEVARALGITKSAVSQIEQRAFRKLRQALVVLGIDAALVREAMREAICWWNEGEKDSDGRGGWRRGR